MARHKCAVAARTYGKWTPARPFVEDASRDDPSAIYPGGGHVQRLFCHLYGGGAEGERREKGKEGNDEKEEIAPKIITFEINDEQEEFTRPWIENSPVAEYIDFRIGDAITEAPKLGMTFDMAFIDGDKRTYVETYEAVLPLMRPGGFILADNTLWDGHVCDPAYDHDQQTLGIREFNDYIAKDPRVEVVILPMRDGLTMIKVKK